MAAEPLPEWALDGSPAPLAGFKKQFPDYALKQNPNILPIFEKGITSNSRDRAGCGRRPPA